MFHIFVVPPSTDGQSGWFHFWAIVTSAAVNTEVQGSPCCIDLALQVRTLEWHSWLRLLFYF